MSSFLVQSRCLVTWPHVQQLGSIWLHSQQPIILSRHLNYDYVYLSCDSMTQSIVDYFSDDRPEGNYALVALNIDTGYVYVCNDPLANRPLVLYSTTDDWALASDYTSLFTDSEDRKQLNHVAVDDFLVMKDLYHPINEHESFYLNTKLENHGCIYRIDKNDITKHVMTWTLSEDKISFDLKFSKLYRRFEENVLKQYNSSLHTSSSSGLDSIALLSVLKKHALPVHAHVSAPAYPIKEGLSVTYDESTQLFDYVKDTNMKLTVHNEDTLNAYEVIDEMLNLFQQPYKLFETSAQSLEIVRSLKPKDTLLTAVMGNFTLSIGHPFVAFNTLLKQLRGFKLLKAIHTHAELTNASRLKLVRAWMASWSRKPSHWNEYIQDHLINKPRYKRKSFVINTLSNEIETYLNMNAIGINQFFYHQLSQAYDITIKDATYTKELIKEACGFTVEHVFHKYINRSIIRCGFKDIPIELRMNMKFGVQGADMTQRLSRSWLAMKNEVIIALNHPIIQARVNTACILNQLSSYVINTDVFQPFVVFVMRVIILHRFLIREKFYA